MDLIYFFKVLFRKKWIITGLSFLSVIAALIFLLNKKDLYMSQAQYSTGFTAEKVRLVDGSSGIDIYTADVKFNNAIETFKSPKVINTIGYKLLLHDLKNPSKSYRKLTKKQTESDLCKAVNTDTAIRILEDRILNGKLLSSDTEKEKVLIEFFKLFGYDYETLRSFLSIERVGRTDYLNISFWSENPNLSALIVNAMGQEFLNYYKNLSSQRTGENAEGIKKIVTAQQDRIDSLGKRLYNEKVRQGSIDPVSLSTSAMETVKELETRLAEEKSKQNEHLNRKKYLMERLSVLEAGAAAVSTNSGSNDEVIRLTNKKNELVAELARKGGSDPALEKQISDLRSEINSRSGSASSGRNNSGKAKEIDNLKIQISEEDALLSAANSTVADYSSRIRKYTGMANSAPVGSDVTIEGIRSKLEIENTQLGIVMEKYSQAEGLVKDDPTTNFIQTGVGQPALGPESKKTMLTMALSGISMFFLSSVIFLLLEIFDPRIKTPALFKKQVKLNMVSVLNNVPLKKMSEEDILMNDYEGKKFAQQTLFKNNVRKLRHELLKSTHKIFLITSTQKGAGKTTVIEALAASLVLSKKKVLLIDLNFGNNTLTQKHNPASLIQDVAGTINYNLPLISQKIWSAAGREGLFAIGCKEGNFTPSEALYNIDMNLFLKLSKDEFDFIIIEGAALNDFADSRELAAYAEEIFTVFSAASAVSHADDKSIKFIASLGEKNKGTVLNNVLKENINF
jgi:polysaccharide biosynthesis transport protein